jgi:tetratricopeptide (TPR) repeat protein
MRFFGAIVILCVWLAGAAAMHGQIALDKPQPDYSKEPFVIQKYSARVNFHDDGTWTRDEDAAIRMESEAGVQRYGLLVFPYSNTNDKIEIRFVRVRKADGTVVETPPENAQDLASEVNRQAPMYTDYHEKHVAVKGLGVGDTLEFSLRVEEFKPQIPGQFWFEYNFTKSNIIFDEELQISVPKGREVKLKSRDVKPEVSDGNQQRVYQWKTSNTKPPSDKPKATKDALPSVQLSSFNDWKEVAAWWGLLEEQQVQPTQEIRDKAAQLTKNAATDSEKVHAIYHYVATHFRYISLSFGVGRYQPHFATDILRNEYGDCKDKHTLLESLLRASGVNAYPVLIGSERKLDPDVPSPAQFDHVISVVPEANDLVWLDTTTEVSPFGFLLAGLRDKQALVVSYNKPAPLPSLARRLTDSPLVKTPADPPFKSEVKFEIDAKLDNDGTLTGEIQRTLRGDFEVILRVAFRRTAQAQWKDLVQQFSYNSGFSGAVSDVIVRSPEDTSNPLHISYAYNRKDYPDWANRRISPPSPLQVLPEPSDEEMSSSEPMELGPKSDVSSLSRVKIPKGFTPALHSNVDVVSDFAEFHAKYAFKDQVLTVNYSLITKKLELPASRRWEYRDFAKEVNGHLQEYTQFAAPGESADTILGADKAANLLEQARTAFQMRDNKRALQLLKDATAADPKNKVAWKMLAGMQFFMQLNEDGFGSMRKAVELDPKDFAAHKTLADQYAAMNRADDAIAAYRSTLKIDENCFDCRKRLGALLLEKQQYSDARLEFSTALANNSGDGPARTGLARAYLGEGKNDKAMEEFKKSAESDPSSSNLNEVAWYMAEGGQHLPEALEYITSAVKITESDSANVDLDELRPVDLRQMDALAAYWDTLGWVYFKQGDLTNAIKYLVAAWNLSQAPEMGLHLAELYEKQGKRAEAIHFCALAMASLGHRDYKDLREYFEKLVPDKSKRDDLVRTGAEDLSQMRLFHLTRPAGGKPGSAEFFALFVPGGKVQEAKFISGEEALKPLSKEIAAAPYSIPFPDNTEAKLLRRGILMCISTSTRCDFVLIPPADVVSTK